MQNNKNFKANKNRILFYGDLAVDDRLTKKERAYNAKRSSDLMAGNYTREDKIIYYQKMKNDAVNEKDLKKYNRANARLKNLKKGVLKK